MLEYNICLLNDKLLQNDNATIWKILSNPHVFLTMYIYVELMYTLLHMFPFGIIVKDMDLFIYVD